MFSPCFGGIKATLARLPDGQQTAGANTPEIGTQDRITEPGIAMTTADHHRDPRRDEEDRHIETVIATIIGPPVTAAVGATVEAEAVRILDRRVGK